ncbi:MAG: hypothetical protein ACJ8C4_11030 [Gemmataceae bacterium]
MIKAIATALYVIVGVAFLAAGASVLLIGTTVLPTGARDTIMHVAHGDANTLHVLQEFGSLLVFAGLMTLWFAMRYYGSRAFHFALTVFWVLLAWVHWYDIHGVIHTGRAQLLISIPAAVFLVVGIARQVTDGRGT